MPESLKHLLKLHETRLTLVILAMAAILLVSTPEFATLQNLVDVLSANAFIGIMSAGLLVVIITGGIDLSFAATASVAQYAALTVANHAGIGWPGVFVLLKPSLAPFALAGIRRRSWWVAALLLGLLSLAMLPLWLEYPAAIRNSDVGATYSLQDIPPMLIPVVAWLGRRPGGIERLVPALRKAAPGLRT